MDLNRKLLQMAINLWH